METKIEKLENNTVKLDITIDAETAMTEYNKACKRLAQRVNIPGFRKGKAPRAILEKNIGTESIKRDVLDYMLPNVFAEAIKKNDLNIITEPYIESFTFDLDKPVTIVAKMELKPEVKFGQYKDIEVEVEEFKTAEGAMQKEIDELTAKFTTMEPVEGRATTGKDIVTMDFDGTCNGEAIQGGSAKNYMLDLENSNFIPGFAEQLVGHNIGEEFTIDVTFPAEYHDEKLKGQPAQFKIKINEIKEKVKAELNDELAAKVGPFKSVDELKADIEKYLENNEKVENAKRSSAKVFEAVLAKMNVDIQDTMVERETQALTNEFRQRVAQSGVKWEDVVNKEGGDKVNAELREEAINRIKNSLMISEIAKIENLQVTSEDLDEKLGELAMMYQTDKGSILKEVQKNSGMIQSLSQQALSQKVTKFLLDSNKIKYVTPKKK